jgi:hypothetical protein
MLKRPELVSDTYLSVLLAQLQAEGYQIFIVNGELPSCEAERVFAYRPINVKQILAEQNAKRSRLQKKAPANFDGGDDEFDEEMKRAIQMSLNDNEKELSISQYANMFPPPSSSTSTSASLHPPLTAEEIRQKRLEFLNAKKP